MGNVGREYDYTGEVIVFENDTSGTTYVIVEAKNGEDRVREIETHFLNRVVNGLRLSNDVLANDLEAKTDEIEYLRGQLKIVNEKNWELDKDSRKRTGCLPLVGILMSWKR